MYLFCCKTTSSTQYSQISSSPRRHCTYTYSRPTLTKFHPPFSTLTITLTKCCGPWEPLSLLAKNLIVSRMKQWWGARRLTTPNTEDGSLCKLWALISLLLHVAMPLFVGALSGILGWISLKDCTRKICHSSSTDIHLLWTHVKLIIPFKQIMFKLGWTLKFFMPFRWNVSRSLLVDCRRIQEAKVSLCEQQMAFVLGMRFNN